jgi:hypothetical protein
MLWLCSRSKRRSSGGHKKALCDALVLTEILAIVVLVAWLFVDHMPLLVAVILASVESNNDTIAATIAVRVT